MLLDKQNNLSHQFPMPVDITDEASRVIDVSGETLQFVVASTNVNDAGSAAGTIIYARLANSGILDAMKARVGNKSNSSFSFGTGTCLTTRRMLDFNTLERAYAENKTLLETATAVTTGFSNGDYVLDNRTGIIFGKKATTASSDTCSYSYRVSTVTSTNTAVAATSSPTLSNVSVSASSFTVLAANARRKGAIIYNDGTANVYIKLGATASTSSFTYKMLANNTLTIPEPNAPIHTEIIDAIGDSATGTLRVTEIV